MIKIINTRSIPNNEETFIKCLPISIKPEIIRNIKKLKRKDKENNMNKNIFSLPLTLFVILVKKFL